MFSTKGRLKAALMVVGVLAVGVGMYGGFQVQEAEAHPHPGMSCSDARWDCCDTIWWARQICGMFPSSGACADAAE